MRKFLILTGAFALAAIALGSFLLQAPLAPEPAPEPVIEDITPSRDVTPPGALPWPKPEEPVERLPAEPLPPPPPEPPKPDIFPRVVVADSGTLISQDTTLELADVIAPALDATCTDATNTTWPCGQAAATALRMFVRGRAVRCAPVDDDAAPRTCTLGPVDISLWLIEQGWAEPSPGAPGFYAEAHEKAQTDKKGLYLERWNSTLETDSNGDIRQ